MRPFVLLGDSLFQRVFSQDKDSECQTIGSLGPRLGDAYARKLDVVNRGFSGYNTRQILALLDNKDSSIYWHRSPKFVTILLGANDARLPDTPGGPQQHVPLDEFKRNLTTIVRRMLKMLEHRPEHVVLVTPPPVDERMTVEADNVKNPELDGIVRRTAATTASYARAVREVAKEINAHLEDPLASSKDKAENAVHVLDLWSIMMKRARHGKQSQESRAFDSEDVDEQAELLDAASEGSSESSTDTAPLPGASEAPPNAFLRAHLLDGLHFSRRGYDLFFDELMALIRRTWPTDAPENMPMAAPAWDAPNTWTTNG